MFSSVAWPSIATIIVFASLSLYVTASIKSLLKVSSLQRSHHVHDPLIYMQQFGIRQRPRVRRTHAVEDILFPARLIHRKTRRLFELSNRACSCGALADEANDLNIQLIDLFSPVGDLHPVSSPCSSTPQAQLAAE